MAGYRNIRVRYYKLEALDVDGEIIQIKVMFLKNCQPEIWNSETSEIVYSNDLKIFLKLSHSNYYWHKEGLYETQKDVHLGQCSLLESIALVTRKQPYALFAEEQILMTDTEYLGSVGHVDIPQPHTLCPGIISQASLFLTQS
jgi:hypothetical protein